LFVMYEQCLIEKLQINANISTDIKWTSSHVSSSIKSLIHY
jgi:hypothetical protein